MRINLVYLITDKLYEAGAFNVLRIERELLINCMLDNYFARVDFKIFKYVKKNKWSTIDTACF